MNNETAVRERIERNFGNRTIRVQGLLKRRKETLRDFIINFFEDWNDQKNTIYVDNREVQTDPGRRRSLGDIYMICKYYYPNCTVGDVFNILRELCENESGYRSSCCFTINKRVYYYDSGSSNNIFNRNQTDEFGFTYNDYVGQANDNTENDEDDD